MTKPTTNPLHVQFDAAMMDTYHRAKSECRYNATYFLQLLLEVGGVEAAKRLLASENPAAGLTTLWECGRLDLSVEAKVLLPAFAGLFLEEEQAVARVRLALFGYQLS